MTLSASKYQNQNENPYGIEEEKPSKKKSNFKHNISGRPFTQIVTATFEHLQKIDPLAACLWFTMISLPEYWNYRIPDLAKRIGVCENTCRLKMNILIEQGLVNRKKVAGGKTEYTVYQSADDNPLKSQSTTKSLDLTSLYKKKEINTYNNNLDNNKLVAKPVPKTEVVVVPPQNISKPEKQGLDPIPKFKQVKITPEAKQTVIDVIDKIPPEKKETLSDQDKKDIKVLLFRNQNLSIIELADRTIHAIDNAKDNIPGYLRASIDKQWNIKPQKHYQDYENRDTIYQYQQTNNRKSFDEKYERMKKLTQEKQHVKTKKTYSDIQKERAKQNFPNIDITHLSATIIELMAENRREHSRIKDLL